MKTVFGAAARFMGWAVISLVAFPATAQTSEPAEAPATAIAVPALAGPLTANPDPINVDFGGFLGKMYVDGVLTGLAAWQDNPASGDRHALADIDNAQIFLQTTDGPAQIFLQAGGYSVPAVGAPYLRTSRAVHTLFGPLPVAYVKIAPSDTVSIEIGKLPTLIGIESAFTFQNMNVQRGILWNQTSDVSRGVQANYTAGPIAFALSWNDGYYSGRYRWLTGSVTWTLGPSDTLLLIGGGNLGVTRVATYITPLAQDNQQIVDLAYTYSAGPWMAEPSVQWTRVPADRALGFGQTAETYGTGIYASYRFGDSGFSLPGRLEYIASTGSRARGAANLVFGPGSDAWAFTLTPTWQRGIVYARGELAYVEAGRVTPGLGLGPRGLGSTQTRLLIETGILF